MWILKPLFHSEGSKLVHCDSVILHTIVANMAILSGYVSSHHM